MKCFLILEPITILSGKRKSLIASPSLKNSGFDIISKLFFLSFLRIFSIRSPVPTGTVDLLTIIFFFLVFFAISRIALITKDKSTSDEFFLLGVPTQIKIKSDDSTAFFMLFVKNNLPSL